LFCQGFNGGREAAAQLLNLSKKGLSLTQSTKVLIHVFANVTGLALTLAQCGIIPKAEIFHEFVNGFNTVDELITFVNVCHSKELTDSKVNGISPWSVD
jgi:hypothetical protein